MPLPDSIIEDKCKGIFEEIIPQIQSSQEEFFSNKGRFFQSIPNDPEIPTDGVEKTPIFRKPTDQSEGWDAFPTVIPEKLPFSMELNIYEKEGSKGWELRAYILIEGKIWECVPYASSPEEFRMHDWNLIS